MDQLPHLRVESLGNNGLSRGVEWVLCRLDESVADASYGLSYVVVLCGVGYGEGV